MMNQKSQLSTNLCDYWQLPPQKIAEQLYSTIQSYLADNTQSWYLLGTEGCHLCDEVAQFLNMNAHRLVLPPILILDIMDFLDSEKSEFMKQASPFIPILITPSDFLCHPFGIMDILQIKK